MGRAEKTGDLETLFRPDRTALPVSANFRDLSAPSLPLRPYSVQNVCGKQKKTLLTTTVGFDGISYVNLRYNIIISRVFVPGVYIRGRISAVGRRPRTDELRVGGKN